MVSAQRVREKLNRFHAKLMAYEEMLTSGMNPEFTDVINRAESRLGKGMTDKETARAKQAQRDLFVDVERNLDLIELSLADYFKELTTQGISDYIAVLKRIKEEMKPGKA